MEYKWSYSHFELTDGIGATIETRIGDVVALLKNEDDFIVFEDGRKCKNADEVRILLKEKGIL